jgi:hypothetical protein
MRFWVRELAGWLLVGLGLLVFYYCFLFLANGIILEAGPLTVIGVFIFRGGIHLLKMAVAARVVLQANTLLREQEPAAPRPAGTLGRQNRSV